MKSLNWFLLPLSLLLFRFRNNAFKRIKPNFLSGGNTFLQLQTLKIFLRHPRCCRKCHFTRELATFMWLCSPIWMVIPDHRTESQVLIPRIMAFDKTHIHTYTYINPTSFQASNVETKRKLECWLTRRHLFLCDLSHWHIHTNAIYGPQGSSLCIPYNM